MQAKHQIDTLPSRGWLAGVVLMVVVGLVVLEVLLAAVPLAVVAVTQW